MEFLAPVLSFDQWLFAKINQDWTNSFLDWFFPNVTDLHKNPATLVIVMLLLAYWVFKKRTYALKCILALILAVTLSDTLAYRVIKSAVRRPRPPDSGIAVVIRTPHHSGFSFPSNHATNMFTEATVLSLAIPPAGPVFFLIAVLIAYSRVYVGVHFPLDVLGGAFLGTLVGFIVWWLMRRWILKSAPILLTEKDSENA